MRSIYQDTLVEGPKAVPRRPVRNNLLSGQLGELKPKGPDLNVIRKHGFFCRTSSGVRLCWELEEPEGPKAPKPKNRTEAPKPKKMQDLQAVIRAGGGQGLEAVGAQCGGG